MVRPPCRAVAPVSSNRQHTQSPTRKEKVKEKSSNRQHTQSPTRKETVVRCAFLSLTHVSPHMSHPILPTYYRHSFLEIGARGIGDKDAQACVCVCASDQVMSILCLPTSSASRLTLCGRINRAAAPLPSAVPGASTPASVRTWGRVG